ncbi:unnamed protein product, partial [Rotaria socialis]
RAAVTANKAQKQTPIRINSFRLMTDETSKRVARENFVISTVSMSQLASSEPFTSIER